MAGGGPNSDDGCGGMFAAINVTPMVDVTLVLLVIFMVAAPLIVANPSIKVALPKAATGEETKRSTLALTLERETAGGYKLYRDGQPTDERAVRALVPGLLKSDPELQAVVAADRGFRTAKSCTSSTSSRGSA